MSYYAPDYARPKWQARVSPGSAFVFHDGPEVHSLAEMGEALRSVSEAVLQYHTGVSHDIADWVAHVVGDDQLAQVLRSESSRMALLVALEQYMALMPDTPWYVARYWLRDPVHDVFVASRANISSMKAISAWLIDVEESELDTYWLASPNALSQWLSSVVGDYVLADELEAHKPVSRVLKLVVDRRLAQLERYAEQTCSISKRTKVIIDHS